MNTVYPQPHKQYKVFLVELDDDDRERVLSGRVSVAEITSEPNYQDVFSEYSMAPVAHYMVSEDVTMTLKMVPNENGTIFTIEDFSKDEQ